jgi:hypothetical protein
MSDLETYELVQKEAKTVQFTVKDADGEVVNVSGAWCSFYGKRTLGTSTYLFEKNDSSFNKSNGANGILTVALDKDDLNWYGDAYAIVKIILTSGSDEDKHVFKLHLTQSVE